MIRILACGLILAAVVLAGSVAVAVEFRAVHGVDGGGFQKWFDESVEAGFRLTYVQGLKSGDAPIFAAIAIKDGNNYEFQARYGVTEADLKKTTADLTAKGFRVSCLSGYIDGEDLRFAAIWTKGEKKGPWHAGAKSSSADYQMLFNHFTQQGLMPVFLTGYADAAGESKLGMVFAKGGEGEWTARHDLTADQYQNVVSENADKGMRPISLAVYPGANGPRFGVVMQKDGVAWTARHNLTADQYQQQFNQQAQKGLRPLCISAYLDGDELRYAAVWIKDPPPQKEEGKEQPGDADGVIR